MLRGKLLIAAVIGFMTLLASSHVFSQADVIEKRQAAMKANSADAKAIKAALESKDYAVIETKAKDIMGTAERIPSLFTKGSTTGKTKATDAIWEKSDDFAKDSKNLTKGEGELAHADKAKDDEEIGVKVKALGEACGACHKAFRAEKYTE